MTGTSHVMRRAGMLQIGQHTTDAFDMVGVQPAGVIAFEQRSQSLMGKLHTDEL